MDFYIKQGATSPSLKMRVVDNDNPNINDMFENCEITFEMNDIKTGSPIILNGVCSLSNAINKFNNVSKDYYIVYQFTEEQTLDVGRFEGKFTVKFLDNNQNVTSKLIAPIKEKLIINIL